MNAVGSALENASGGWKAVPVFWEASPRSWLQARRRECEALLQRPLAALNDTEKWQLAELQAQVGFCRARLEAVSPALPGLPVSGAPIASIMLAQDFAAFDHQLKKILQSPSLIVTVCS
jgi:hypothetical protein